MSNQNNCASCDHKHNPDGGWCYMFRAEPGQVCGLHSMRHRAAAKTDVIGRAMQQMTEGGMSLMKALDTALKAYDH